METYCAPILKLLAGKNETLLVRGDALFVLYFRLDVVDGIRRLNLEGDSYTALATMSRAEVANESVLLPVRVLTKICMMDGDETGDARMRVDGAVARKQGRAV